MIIRPEPFLPGRQSFPLRADDLNNLADAVNRAGRLTGGGTAYATAGNNPSVFVPPQPRQIKGFWAKIGIPIGTNADYTDERYYVFRQRATGGAGMDDQITREDDRPTDLDEGQFSEFWPLTASNRAEIHDHTHTLPDGMEVWVTGEADWSENPVIHYSFFASSPGGLTVHDCADAGGPATTEKFAGGFTVSFAGSVANVAPNIIADPASPGISVINGNGATCGPVKIGCNGLLSDVYYSGGVFYKVVCGGAPQVVFSTTSCPTSPGVSAAEFFSYNN